MSRQYDVIVVGGGPAGSASARTCALGGLKTLLIERSEFPRLKPCAGGVSAAALTALSDIDLNLPDEIVEQRIRRLRPGFRLPGGPSSAGVQRDTPFMVTVNRDRFDHYLLDGARNAGTDALLGTPVKTIEVTDEKVTAVTPAGSYSAKLLIGADGIRGVTSINVRRPLTQTEMAVTVCGDLDVDIPDRERSEIDPEAIEITYGLPDMGYSWVFPKRQQLSVGSGGLAGRSKNLKEEFFRFLELRGLPQPARVRGHWVALGGLKLKIAGNRILLVGDSAGFGDPFTGEGIRWALVSGRLAGEAAIRAIAGRSSGSSPDSPRMADSLQWYDRTCHELIVRQLMAASLLTRFFFRLPQDLNAQFLANTEMLSRLIDVIEGRSNYRRLLRQLALKFPPRLSISLLFGGNDI